MPENCAIELKNIRKCFGKVIANDGINLVINRGEILCLLGENGSGKTTLMNMLSGIYQPDGGQIFCDGSQVSIRSPHDAHKLGIGMIHQHYHLVDVFTAAQNIVLGLEEKFDISAVNEKVSEICSKYGFIVDPKKKVYDMSVSEKQTIEIVKQLYRGAEILILDEPTAVLTPQETNKLFAVLRNMKQDNKAIVLITHKLAEVLAVSDKVAILRKGRYIGTVNTKDATAQSLTDMMVGRSITLNIDRPKFENSSDKLIVENLRCLNSEGIEKLKGVSFTAKTGEILGVAGIAGSGQRELLESISGLHKTLPGSSIKFINDDGSTTELVGKTPMEIKKVGVGMGFVPEDRLGMGLVGSMGMTNNMMLRSWTQGKSIFFNRKNPENLAKKVWEELEVVTPSTVFPVRRMSGGNIQKVLVGREIASHPPVLLTAYAVRGLDINTSYSIYNLLTEQKMRGSAVLYIGEELDVLLELCDRILVLCDGQVSGIVDARTTTKEEIGLLMTSVGAKEAR